MKAAVVGSGPNGLAAALVLAKSGIDVTVFEAEHTPGGGMRSHENLRSGVIHDMCSAVHPMVSASSFFEGINLERHGLHFSNPEVDLAHPLDDGSAGILFRDLEETILRLGKDGLLWQATFAPLTNQFKRIASDIMAPAIHVPRSPLATTLFALNAALPANLTSLRWRNPITRALFGGVAAHSFSRLNTPLSSAVGVMLIAAAHHGGWPVAVGGSQSITNALISELAELGVEVVCDTQISALEQIGDSDITMLDTTPQTAAEILGDNLPNRTRRAYTNFKHGPGTFKVDFLISGNIPWKNPDAKLAGTVHLGGTFREIASVEKQIALGKMPDNPFVLVGQQYLADQSRSDLNYNPVWAYAHVPHGYEGDASELIIKQIERFAPGFRDTIVEFLSFKTADLQNYNINYVGGDIIGGQTNARQLIARPIASTNPYFTGIPGIYLCSASTPPGAGVHGMCGKNAAEAALKDLRLI